MATKLDDVKADIRDLRKLTQTLTIDSLHQDVQRIVNVIERLCDVVEKLLAKEEGAKGNSKP